MDILGATPYIILTTAATWVGQGFLYRARQKKVAIDHDDRLEIHRDELTFELLEAARTEMKSARAEVDDLREETRKLRSLEQHFFHFQQSLDHIEALLESKTNGDRQSAERNARAFLNRMRRLNDAKGTIRNETQTLDSTVALAEREIGEGTPND